MPTIYDFSPVGIDGRPRSLADFRGRVLLIVNVASRCGFTPQYRSLQNLYQRLRPRGFVILGFPCNQFGAQEPGNEAQIALFCERDYGITFPLFAKIDVNGAEAAPLYRYLTHAKRGILGTPWIKWNFTKFLIDRNGAPVRRYASRTDPSAIAPDIEAQLGA